MIPKSKTGDCCQCDNKNVPVVKVGKELFCLYSCHRKNKAKAQMQKSVLKNKVRSLGDSEENKTMLENNAAKQRWFNERRKEMKGFCQNCGGKSCKDSDEYFRFSIAHILPKAYFKSVSTHEDNWLELCHFGNSCHTNLDNAQIDLIDLNCFDTVIEKFVRIYPNIAQDEKRRIPFVLMEYLKTETN